LTLIRFEGYISRGTHFCHSKLSVAAAATDIEISHAPELAAGERYAAQRGRVAARSRMSLIMFQANPAAAANAATAAVSAVHDAESSDAADDENLVS